MITPIKKCADKRPHKPHTWSAPSTEKGKTLQVFYKCPGVKE